MTSRTTFVYLFYPFLLFRPIFTRTYFSLKSLYNFVPYHLWNLRHLQNFRIMHLHTCTPSRVLQLLHIQYLNVHLVQLHTLRKVYIQKVHLQKAQGAQFTQKSKLPILKMIFVFFLDEVLDPSSVLIPNFLMIYVLFIVQHFHRLELLLLLSEIPRHLF